MAGNWRLAVWESILPNVSVAQLVVKSQGGDRQAYAALIGRYTQEIYGLCLAALGNVHDAEDVTQEVLVKGFTRIRQLRDPNRFEAWLKRMGRNLCRDWLRKKARHRETALASLEPAAETVERDSRLGRVAQAIQELPAKYRRVIQLRYLEGKRGTEVAELLNLSPARVNTQLFRARKLLMAALSERGGVL